MINPHISGAFFKAIGYLDESKKAVVSVSGGSDSDVVVDFINQCGFGQKVQYVFFDTGLEYDATLSHLDYLEDRYEISIDRVKAYRSIPHCCKTYGVPFISKQVSEFIYRLQKHDFDWRDGSYDELIKDYPMCESALKWWTNSHEDVMMNISRRKYLKEFLLEYPPNFRVSNKCCAYAKKKTAEKYNLDNNINMVITGIRKAEGGVRSKAYSSCFSEGKGISQYRPIFWFTNQDKEEYCKMYSVKHSDCYEKYGLCRTGCAGCPYGKEYLFERDVLCKYEPKLYRVTESIFSDAYNHTQKYMEFRSERERADAYRNQTTLEGWL